MYQSLGIDVFDAVCVNETTKVINFENSLRNYRLKLLPCNVESFDIGRYIRDGVCKEYILVFMNFDITLFSIINSVVVYIVRGLLRVPTGIIPLHCLFIRQAAMCEHYRVPVCKAMLAE